MSAFLVIIHPNGVLWTSTLTVDKALDIAQKQLCTSLWSSQSKCCFTVSRVSTLSLSVSLKGINHVLGLTINFSLDLGDVCLTKLQLLSIVLDKKNKIFLLL